MRDNELFSLIIQIIIAGESTLGIGGIPVAQRAQPTTQGVASTPIIYVDKIPGDHRYGSVLRKDIWNAQTEIMEHLEIQDYESTFQFSALAGQSAATPMQFTASDIINSVAAILQSSCAIQAFINAGVGVRRITDIRNPAFIDEKQRYEFSPSFDITLTHKQIIKTVTPIIAAVTLQVDEV
jgi:hypothetical protein